MNDLFYGPVKATIYINQSLYQNLKFSANNYYVW